MSPATEREEITRVQTMFTEMLKDCPSPSIDELSKLLAFQGYYWQKMSFTEAGLAEVESKAGSTKQRHRMKTALAYAAESRACLISAAKLVESELKSKSKSDCEQVFSKV